MRLAAVAIFVGFLLVACSPGGDPGPQPELQASVGTFTLEGDSQTAFNLLAKTPGSTDAVKVTVSGPEGWNGGAEAEATVAPGVAADHVVGASPVSGNYMLSMTVNGRTYSATVTLDADSALAPVANVVITEATADHVTMSWDPVPGADSYEAQLQEIDSGEVVASETGTDTTATLNVPVRPAGAGLGLAAVGDYRVAVIAKSGAGATSSPSFGAPANRSYGASAVINIPEVTHDAPAFQALAGTFNSVDGLETFFVVYTPDPGELMRFEFEVSGPAGWNGDEPWTDEKTRGVTWLLSAEIPPVSGEYRFRSVIDGVTYTDSFVMDAEQVFTLPDGITVEASSLTSLSLTWNAVEGTFDYWVRVLQDGTLIASGFDVTETNSITFDELELEADVEYTIRITAFAQRPGRDPADFVVQVNGAEAESEPFQVEVSEDPPQIETATGGFTATDAVGFVDAAGVATYYAPSAVR